MTSAYALPCVICRQRSGFELPASGRRVSIRCPTCATTYRVVTGQVRSVRVSRGWRVLWGLLETLLTDHQVFKLRVYDQSQDKERLIEFGTLDLLGPEIVFDPLDRIACLYFEGDLVAVANLKLDVWAPTVLGALLRLRSRLPLGLGDLGPRQGDDLRPRGCPSCERETPHAQLSRWRALSLVAARLGWERAALVGVLAVFYLREALVLLVLAAFLVPRPWRCEDCGAVGG